MAANHRRCRGLLAVARFANSGTIPRNPARTVSIVRPAHRAGRRGFCRRGSRLSCSGEKCGVAMVVANLRKESCFFQNYRIGLQICRRSSNGFFAPDALALGQARRTAWLFSHALVFPTRAWIDLSCRVRFVMDAGRWPHRSRRHFAGGSIHVRRQTAM